MKIPFVKMSGSGNDFIIIDHRNPFLEESSLVEFIKKVCQRRISVGADGLILVENSDKADFKWRFFNSDGSEAEMCGNGGRCVARFAFLKGISGSNLTFETMAGILSAEVKEKSVKLELTKPHSLKIDDTILVEGKELIYSYINTGVPHTVLFTQDIERVDVVKLGGMIRFHPQFAPNGTNVNFVRLDNGNQLSIRTYERGVENETLACGTGAVASALIAGFKGRAKSPISINTRGGEVLIVHFEIEGEEVKKVFLEGGVHIIYEAEMWEEAYK